MTFHPSGMLKHPFFIWSKLNLIRSIFYSSVSDPDAGQQSSVGCSCFPLDPGLCRILIRIKKSMSFFLNIGPGCWFEFFLRIRIRTYGTFSMRTGTAVSVLRNWRIRKIWKHFLWVQNSVLSQPCPCLWPYLFLSVWLFPQNRHLCNCRLLNSAPADILGFHCLSTSISVIFHIFCWFYTAKDRVQKMYQTFL